MLNKKNPARVEAGHRNIQNGKTAEILVKAACDVYRKNGIAFIEKNAEPVQVLGPVKSQGGIYFMRFAYKAKPDYEGVLAGGRGILFDVKSTVQEVIKASTLTKGQAAYLEQYDKMGAVSAILVCMKFKDYYMVPWSIWKKMKELYGHMHMNKEELEPYRVLADPYIHFLEHLGGNENGYEKV